MRMLIGNYVYGHTDSKFFRDNLRVSTDMHIARMYINPLPLPILQFNLCAPTFIKLQL